MLIDPSSTKDQELILNPQHLEQKSGKKKNAAGSLGNPQEWQAGRKVAEIPYNPAGSVRRKS